MATRDELYAALQKADAAGNTADAKQLADYIRALPTDAPTPAQAPQQSPEDQAHYGRTSGANSAIDTVMDPILHVGSGMVASAVGGLHGLGKLAAGQGLDAAVNAVKKDQDALTYQPKSAGGKATTAVATYPFKLLNQATDYAGGKVAQGATALGASPEVAAGLGTAANIGLNLAVPAKLAKGLKAPEAAAAPEQAAEAYVARNTALDWSSLSDKTKQTLTAIASDAKNLDNLDPKAVERQARVDSLNVPATRGQITRDLAQITREENISKSDAGKPIRDINAAQDARLHELLDTLKKDSGGTAETKIALGESLQDNALRAKEASSKGRYNALYSKARATEPDAEVSAAPMYDLLKTNPEIQHLGFVKTWLDRSGIKESDTAPRTAETIKAEMAAVSKKAQSLPEDLAFDAPEHTALATQFKSLKDELANVSNGQPAAPAKSLKLSELDDLRKKASGLARAGGDNGYYAGQVVSAIDKSFEAVPSAAKAWTDARDAFKAHKREFEDQRAVDKLVGDKTRTDRNTALEDTFDVTVKNGTRDGLKQVIKSLSDTGPGKQAIRDLQGATIKYLKDAASNRNGATGEAGQAQFNSSFIRAVNDLEADGKLDVIFNPQQVAQLRKIRDVAVDIRTKPAGRIAGSDTIPRMLATLEKMANIPVLGDIASGTVRAAQKIHSMGKEGREAAKAARSPLEETAVSTTRTQTAGNRNRKALNSLATYAPGSQRN